MTRWLLAKKTKNRNKNKQKKKNINKTLICSHLSTLRNKFPKSYTDKVVVDEKKKQKQVIKTKTKRNKKRRYINKTSIFFTSFDLAQE